MDTTTTFCNVRGHTLFWGKFKAYIPLRRKISALGPCVGPDPQGVGDTNMLVSKNAKIYVFLNAKPKICVAPVQNPNASQWNMGCVGLQTQHFHVGNVHFNSFCADFICVW